MIKDVGGGGASFVPHPPVAPHHDLVPVHDPRLDFVPELISAIEQCRGRDGSLSDEIRLTLQSFVIVEDRGLLQAQYPHIYDILFPQRPVVREPAQLVAAAAPAPAAAPLHVPKAVLRFWDFGKIVQIVEAYRAFRTSRGEAAESFFNIDGIDYVAWVSQKGYLGIQRQEDYAVGSRANSINISRTEVRLNGMSVERIDSSSPFFLVIEKLRGFSGPVDVGAHPPASAGEPLGTAVAPGAPQVDDVADPSKATVADSPAPMATKPASFQLGVTIPGRFFKECKSIMSRMQAEPEVSLQKIAALLETLRHDSKNGFVSNDAAIMGMNTVLQGSKELFGKDSELVRFINQAFAQMMDPLI